MIRIFSSLLLILMLYASCKKKEQGSEEVDTSTQLPASMIRTEEPITELNPESKKIVAKWPEYQRFSDLARKYQEISMNEAMLNSVELASLAQHLKDSIRIEKFNVPDVKIRLNVLYSESLRLADMSTIPAITEEMVSRENNNMIAAFSALNMKINDMNRQEKLNSEISRFVDEVLEENGVDTANSTQTEIQQHSGIEPEKK